MSIIILLISLKQMMQSLLHAFFLSRLIRLRWSLKLSTWGWTVDREIWVRIPVYPQWEIHHGYWLHTRKLLLGCRFKSHHMTNDRCYKCGLVRDRLVACKRHLSVCSLGAWQHIFITICISMYHIIKDWTYCLLTVMFKSKETNKQILLTIL